MPIRSPFVVLALALIAVTVPAQLTPKVLVIGADGIRPDALAAARTPNLDALIATGSYSAEAQCEDLTFSGPNWSTILHGVHRDKHGVTSNGYGGSMLSKFPDFLAYLESHNKMLATARITTWDAIFQFQPTGADIDLFHDYGSGGDAIATNWAVQLVAGTHPTYPKVDIDALFLYLADGDVVGHAHGFDKRVAAYLKELEDVDAQIGKVMAAVRARPNYAKEDWLVVFTSDHGGSITGGHSGNTPEKRRIPFLVSGRSVVVGTPFPPPKNVDVAKTVLSHMGAAIPNSLDGYVVGLKSSGPPALRYNANLIFNGGAEYDRGFSDFTPDQYISGWNDPGPRETTAIPYGTPGGWPVNSDPGPPNRGKNFFCGSSVTGSRMTQTIDLVGLQASIDAGAVSYDLSGWLGGYLSQNDRTQLSAYFFDGKGRLRGADTIGPVTNVDRGNQTALLYRASTGRGVPPLTRSVVIALDGFFATGGGADGYADELSFVLRAAAGAPPGVPSSFVPTPRTTEWRFTRASGVFVDAAYGPGTMEYADGIGGQTKKRDAFRVSNGGTVPHIDGVPVSYLHFKKRQSATEGYKVRVGIPSAGETGIRQFTMIYDVFVPAGNTDNYLGIWNGDPQNSDDCELFLRPVSEGYWTDAGTRDGRWRRGQWNRIAFAEDFSGAGAVTVYLNGHPALELRDAATDYVRDGDPDPFWFLSDNTPSETSEGFIANFAFVDVVLDAAQIAALGGPAAKGIFAEGLAFYGCAVNPEGSLTRLAGLPFLGTTLTLGVDNPLGTQAVGSTSLLVFGALPDPSFPCGTLIPGWGMKNAAAPGEFLLAGSLVIAVGPSWQGPGKPAAFALPIPNNPKLSGASLFAQGVILDKAKVGLAQAVRITLH